jgi:hypothetical protein
VWFYAIKDKLNIWYINRNYLRKRIKINRRINVKSIFSGWNSH